MNIKRGETDRYKRDPSSCRLPWPCRSHQVRVYWAHANARGVRSTMGPWYRQPIGSMLPTRTPLVSTFA